jgi:hypothetical protein
MCRLLGRSDLALVEGGGVIPHLHFAIVTHVPLLVWLGLIGFVAFVARRGGRL